MTKETDKNPKKKKMNKVEVPASARAFTVEGRSFLSAIKKDGEIYRNIVGIENTNEYPSSILNPPYDPKLLYAIFENSNLLLPNIDAYAANIDGMGFRFTGKLDLTKQDIKEHIKDAIWEDSLITANQELENISEEQISDKLSEIKRRQKIEIVKAKAFFNNCTKRKSFINLRKITRKDLEVTGNAYWEVMRDSSGEIQYLKRIAPSSVRITGLSKETRKFRIYRSLSSLTVEELEVQQKSRSYVVQVGNKNFKYLKEFNCIDLISSETGGYFKDEKEYKSKNIRGKLGDPGNEIIHFSLDENLSPPYGNPRWIGALPDILGSRNVSLYNYSWFEEGLSSPVAVLVSGGSLSDDSFKRIKEMITGSKGVDNAHKILIIEATSGDIDQKNTPTIEIKDLEPMDEANWQDYDANNDQKVGKQFRIPDIVRGSTQDTYNRATAEAALSQCDTQVFAPIRKEFDYFINRQLMPELGFKNIQFVSNGYSSTDIEKLGKLIINFVKERIITISEARTIAEKVFNSEFSPIEGNWGDFPLEFFLQGLLSLTDENSEDLSEDELGDEINNLLAKARKLQIKTQGKDENFK
jgi:PBSX family phage portal protein